MASNIIAHPATPKVLGGALASGVALIIIGAFAGKSVALIAGLCGAGSILTLVVGFGIAVKIDHYYKVKRLEAEPLTPYTPAAIQFDCADLKLKKARDRDINWCIEGKDYFCVQSQFKLDRELRKHNPDVNIRNPMHWDKKIDLIGRLDFEEFNREKNGDL